MKMKFKFTALVADDDENIREILKRSLAEQNIIAEGARDGIAATNMLSNRSYHAVIVDLRMPRKHGHQLVRELLDLHPRPLISVVTGINDPKLTYDLFRRGVDCLDLKPLGIREYAAKIRGLLEHRAEAAKREAAGEGAVVSAENIRTQLKEVTSSFEEAVRQLKAQQAELENGYVGSVRLLTGLLGNTVQSYSVHANRVEAMAVYIGRCVDLSRNALRDLQLAALLHEIGQFSMPDHVKQTPSWQLTAEEREHYERYPVIGATLLSEIPGTEGLVSIVESHAENFNGTGFPSALKQDEIPLGARILRIADGCDSFLMHLSSGDPVEQAKRHLAENLGTAYDPELFKHAISYIHERANEENGVAIIELEARALRPGMELAQSIYDDNGRFLARQGAIVSAALAGRLARLLRTDAVAIRRSRSENGGH